MGGWLTILGLALTAASIGASAAQSGQSTQPVPSPSPNTPGEANFAALQFLNTETANNAAADASVVQANNSFFQSQTLQSVLLWSGIALLGYVFYKKFIK